MYVQKSWGNSRGQAAPPHPRPPPPRAGRAHQQLLLLLVGLRGQARVALVVAVDQHHVISVLWPLFLHYREGAGRLLAQHALLQPHGQAAPQQRGRHLHRLAQLLQAPAGCGQAAGVGGRAPLCPSRAQLGRTWGRGWRRGAARARPPSSGDGACPPGGVAEAGPAGVGLGRGWARLGSSPWSWKYSKTTACTGVTATDRVRSASSTSIVTKPRVCFQLSVRMAWGGQGQRGPFGGSRWTRLYNLGAGGEGLHPHPAGGSCSGSQTSTRWGSSFLPSASSTQQPGHRVPTRHAHFLIPGSQNVT